MAFFTTNATVYVKRRVAVLVILNWKYIAIYRRIHHDAALSRDNRRHAQQRRKCHYNLDYCSRIIHACSNLQVMHAQRITFVLWLIYFLPTALCSLHPTNLTFPKHPTEPPPWVHCFDPASPTAFPISESLCMPVTRKIMRTRRSELPSTHNPANAPWRFTERGTPCVVILGAYDERREGDVFSLRLVALKAVEILETCGEGIRKVGYGGMVSVGPKAKFRVKVDSGVGMEGRNVTAVE